MRKKFKLRVIVPVVAAALALTGGSGYTVYKSKQAADQCAAQESRMAARGPFVQVAGSDARVFILGDSYTAGEHLDNPAQGWAYRVAPAGVGVRADGVGGTGFVSSGWCPDETFGQRLTAAVRQHPETLIIQGGLNDFEASPDEVSAAVYNVLAETKSVPRVIIVGPANAPSRSEGAHKVDAALRSVTEAQGREYVSAIDWPLEFLPDRLHLTPAGHSLFAERVAEELGTAKGRN